MGQSVNTKEGEPEYHLSLWQPLRIYRQTPSPETPLLQPSLTSLTLLHRTYTPVLPFPTHTSSIVAALLWTYPVKWGPRHSLIHTEDRRNVTSLLLNTILLLTQPKIN